MTTATPSPANAPAAPDAPAGRLFVVAAPSGAGKSSLVGALLARESRLGVSISHTTRAPRGQERDGVEYHFVDMARFEQMIHAGEFIEHALVHGNRYGTSRAAVQSLLAQGRDVVFEIDWQGALQIKALFPHALLIFILPPSWQELERRLRGRGEDEPEVINERLQNARVEVAQAPRFDFVIINGDFETALGQLADVVRQQPPSLRYAAQHYAHPGIFQALNLD
jgi:guanylate kinase